MISIIKEEWRSVWRDEGVVLIVVFALFIYGISYSLGYGGEVLTEVPIAVAGGERGDLSRELVHTIDASPKVR
ncbi:MAG: ABC transporter permease, partial [Alistipes sp.]|nr:ABC transporter permease [Alistipes sp.]